jgi:hypothetical protein
VCEVHFGHDISGVFNTTQGGVDSGFLYRFSQQPFVPAPLAFLIRSVTANTQHRLERSGIDQKPAFNMGVWYGMSHGEGTPGKLLAVFIDLLLALVESKTVCIDRHDHQTGQGDRCIADVPYEAAQG